MEENAQMKGVRLQRDMSILREGIYQCLTRADHLRTGLDRGPGAREVALVITKLQEAQHWLSDAIAAQPK